MITVLAVAITVLLPRTVSTINKARKKLLKMNLQLLALGKKQEHLLEKPTLVVLGQTMFFIEESLTQMFLKWVSLHLVSLTYHLLSVVCNKVVDWITTKVKQCRLVTFEGACLVGLMRLFCLENNITLPMTTMELYASVRLLFLFLNLNVTFT